MKTANILAVCTLWVVLGVGCNGSIGEGGGDPTKKDPTSTKCPGGTDLDGDGYGKGCPAGDDCDDNDIFVFPGAQEICDNKDNDCNGKIDEGGTNKCGTCDPGCVNLGDAPFPIDKSTDPALQAADGVGHDKNGDLVLDKSKTDFNFMWIANSGDWSRGTISKIDTVNNKEVARYFTVTCDSQPGAASCVDVNGQPLDLTIGQSPSRTAVDYNFDVWVANRAPSGNPSATKIASAEQDCVDRNGNGTIETSRDRDGDGLITVDCDGDKKPDSAKTVCTVGSLSGKAPEFYGDDDECLLMTVSYSTKGAYGRSVCLSSSIDAKASDVWVGTNQLTQNAFYRISGTTGKLSGPYNLPGAMAAYGCVVDSKGVLWVTGWVSKVTNAASTYIDTKNPKQVGQVISPPTSWGTNAFYGITIDGNDHVWFGGSSTGRVFRYKPNRQSFATLGQGTWTGIVSPKIFGYTRGLGADKRGIIWVAAHGSKADNFNPGYLWRIDANGLADGLHDQSASTTYWKMPGGGVTGAGVDFAGNVWGISNQGGLAARLDVNVKGHGLQPVQTELKQIVKVGKAPYTYSDFTGYGLKNFTRPEGSYVYRFSPCTPGVKALWKRLRWNATVPTNTSLMVRVRAGDSFDSLGSWLGPLSTSPAELTALSPNPSSVLEIELTFKTSEKEKSPVLHDFDLTYTCDPKLK
jgi:streptogramin lyase